LWNDCYIGQGGHRPGKRGKVREFESGREKVGEIVLDFGVLPQVVQ